MYEIQFSKKNSEIGRFYVWNCDLEKTKKHLQEYGHEIIRTNKYNFFKWFYYAYIKEPYRRYKKWWNW